MNEQANSGGILLSIIIDEYSHLKDDERRVLAKMVSEYFELLEDARIEEAAHYLYANYDVLVRLL